MAHIWLVGPAYPYRGGIAHFLENTVRELQREADVSVITFVRLYPKALFPGKTQYDEQHRDPGFEAQCLIDSINPLTWIAVRRRMYRERPDAVIYMHWQPFFAPCFGSIAGPRSEYRPQQIIIAHNVMPHDNAYAQGALTRWLFQRMDHVVLLSDETTEQAAAFVEPERRTTLFHPIYDFIAGADAQDSDTTKSGLGIPNDRPVALFFGYIRSYKGVLDLLEAKKRMDMDAHLLVVGEIYDDREAIEALVTSPELEGRVTLVDRYVANEEVADFFSAADVVILPYRRASQSGIGAIALAACKPMVVTDVGALPRLTEGSDGTQGACGVVVPANDPASLARGIAEVLSKGTEHYREALDAKRKSMSWERFGEKLVELLKLT